MPKRLQLQIDPITQTEALLKCLVYPLEFSFELEAQQCEFSSLSMTDLLSLTFDPPRAVQLFQEHKDKIVEVDLPYTSSGEILMVLWKLVL